MKQTIFKEKTGIRGHVNLRVYDADSGELIPEECQDFDNLITTAGYERLAMALIGDATISYCGVGTGTTTPTALDTGLEDEIPSRIVITDVSRVGAVCNFSTYFGTTDCNDDWNEAGLFTDASGNNMISHALFTTTFEKDSTRKCYVDWNLTIA